jgi:hypothetical protein
MWALGGVRRPLRLVAALILATGCGGSTAQTTADGSVDAMNPTGFDAPSSVESGADSGGEAGADSADGCSFGCNDAGAAGEAAADAPSCPATPPAPQSPCSVPNIVCEYGSSWWLACNAVFVCQGGTWQGSSDGTCALVDAGTTCPDTFDQARSADAALGMCPFANTCIYPEGFCGCGLACGGHGGIPGEVPGFYACIPSTPNCPEPRPLSGTPCDLDASTYCSYGFACGCGQEQHCVDGLWRASPAPACP